MIFGLVVAARALTDKEILQQALNGAFEQNKLPDPTTIIPCIDDDSAHKIVVFTGEVLEKAAKGSVSDLISLISLVKNFGNSLNPAVGQCLNGNVQLDNLADKYGLKGANGPDVQKHIIEYITLHYLQFHKWCQDLDAQWKKGSYYQTGFNGATYAHSMFKMSLIVELTHLIKNLRSN